MYGHDDIFPREHLLRFFFFLKHTSPYGCAHLLSGAKGCSEDAWWASVHRVCSYLNGISPNFNGWKDCLSGPLPHTFLILAHIIRTACPSLV